MKVGRKKEDESIRFRDLAFEFLLLSQIGGIGKQILRDQYGYIDCTKKEFCAKNNLSINYFVSLYKRKDFQDEFWKFVTRGERHRLPIALMQLLKNDPAKWLQVLYNKQVAPLLVQKNINWVASSDEDDEEFRNAFFGLNGHRKNDSES